MPRLLQPLFACFLTLVASAQEPPVEKEDLYAAPLEELADEGASAETLAALLPGIADPEARNSIRSAILGLKPYPGQALVDSLRHPTLAVRLGALELLEERAGTGFTFSPWSPPEAPENEGPLARWQAWAEGGAKATSDEKDKLLGEDQRRGYLRDLLSGDRNQASRARRMLEADGIASIGFLESFLAESPTLPVGSRTKVREAQYQIVLSRSLGSQASTTARHLAFGNRDQLLAALSSLKKAGLTALPILRDFLDHPDPLVRETAIDALLATGGGRAIPLVEPILRGETDANVIHGALRRLKSIPNDTTQSLVASFLESENEDLVISAIQTCLSLAGGASRSSFSSNAEPNPILDPPIIAKLDDPRWRIRATALEYVAGVRVTAAGDKVITMLEDPDEFVRFNAITAVGNLGIVKALPKLKALFLKDEAMVPTVLSGYGALEKEIDAEMLKALKSYSADARLAAVQAAAKDSSMASLLQHLAIDPDLDVACSALRYLGKDDDLVGEPAVATLLVEALRSGSIEKQRAVISQLTLPQNDSASGVILDVLSQFEEPRETTSLDPLYAAFLDVDFGSAEPIEAAVNAMKGAGKALAGELIKIAAKDDEDGYRAALALARANYSEGYAQLTRNLDSYNPGQRANLVDRIYTPKVREALELLEKLVKDPVEEVRAGAVETALSSEASPAFIDLVFRELSRPGTQIQPHEIYNYRLESIVRKAAPAKIARGWAVQTLENESAPPPQQVLALIILRHRLSATQREMVTSLATQSDSPWVRRAAWYALGFEKTRGLVPHADAIASDRHAAVRAIIPALFTAADVDWLHYFSDLHALRNAHWSYSSERTPRPPAAILDHLRRMADNDSSESNRFQAWLALMSFGEPVDTKAFAALIARQPEDKRASYQVAEWMRENLGRLGPGLAPVVGALRPSEVRPEHLQEILAKVSPDQGAGFASFATLVEQESSDAPQVTAVEDPEAAADPVERESLLVLHFIKPGCPDCARIRRLLETMQDDFPKMEIRELSVIDASGAVLNQALCQRFGVPTAQHTLAPAVFTQSGYLIRENIQPAELGKLLATTNDVAQDDSWSALDEPEREAAAEVVEERFEALTLGLVIGAGLLDGINPCAFATIIFFLSYLQIARRSPREMLMVGFAFILAVFLSYFAFGLILHTILKELIERISNLQRWTNWIFGGLALIAAMLSFIDAWKARQGRADEMTLQLPGMLKDRIRGAIRSGAKARRFVLAAFVVGVIVSFLELACTGQVYAPIIYQIQQGSADAVGMLLLYNLAFILPLVIIFVLAWAGLRSESLVRFQQRYTALVKVLLGLLFLGLGWLLLVGTDWLHGG